jgi:hypothetical protein
MFGDSVAMHNHNINPFKSYTELRTFTDLVMKEHEKVDGVVLCRDCHEFEHYKDKSK